MDLGEFLLARIAEDEERDRRRWIAELPEVPEDEAVLAWNKLAATSALRFNIAVRQLGVAIVAALGWRSRLRQLAQPYAHHPDFRPEWSALADA